jgi:hypothetical protein
MVTSSSRSVRAGVSPTMERWRKASEVDRNGTTHELLILRFPRSRRASSYVEINRLIEIRCESLSPSTAIGQNSARALQAYSSLSSDGIFRRYMCLSRIREYGVHASSSEP